MGMVVDVADDGGAPSRSRREELLSRFLGRSEAVLRHCRAAEAVAGRLAEALAAAGVALDMELARDGALLHDLRKGEPDHGPAAARLLAELGFVRAAAVVAVHSDLDGRTPAPGEPITAAEVVYLADKLLLGDRRTSLEEKFRAKRAQAEGDPARLARLEERLARALTVQARLERALGRGLEEVLAG